MLSMDVGNNSSMVLTIPPLWLKRFYAIFVPIFVAYCLISMAANLCILLSVHWIKGGLSATLRLTVSLALSDVLTSVLLGFSFVYNSYLYVVHNIRANACISLTFEALRTGGLLTGTFHLFVLSVNHYLSTAHPFLYKKILTPITTNTIIFLMWIIPPTGLLICFGSIPGQGYRTPNGTCHVLNFPETLEFRLTIFSLICTLLISMSILYVAVLIILHKMKRKFAQKSAYQTQNSARQQQLKRKRNTFITTLLIWGTFFLAWFPTSVFFVLSCDTCPYSPRQRYVNMSVFIFSMFTQFGILTKTLVNPIIYAIRIPEISQVLQNFYKKSCCASSKSGMLQSAEINDTASRYKSHKTTADDQTAVLLKENNNLQLVQENGTAMLTKQ